MERNTLLQTIVAHSTYLTALDFATDSGRRPGYLFYAWAIVGLNPAPSIESVSEKVRELNTYRSWSAYQTEAKLLYSGSTNLGYGF